MFSKNSYSLIMTVFFILFCALFLFTYSYYSILLLFLLLEFFVLVNYFFLCSKLSIMFSGAFMLVLFCCFMVLEAVVMLSFLLSNYRFYGKNYFLLW